MRLLAALFLTTAAAAAAAKPAPPPLQRALGLLGGICQKGSGLACANLGVMYRRGTGVRQDLRKAAGLFAQACQLGSRFGCRQLESLCTSPEQRIAQRTKAPPGVSGLRSSTRRHKVASCATLKREKKLKTTGPLASLLTH